MTGSIPIGDPVSIKYVLLKKLKHTNKLHEIVDFVPCSTNTNSDPMWTMKSTFFLASQYKKNLDWEFAVTLCIQRMIMFELLCEARVSATRMTIEYPFNATCGPGLEWFIKYASQRCENTGTTLSRMIMVATAAIIV